MQTRMISRGNRIPLADSIFDYLILKSGTLPQFFQTILNATKPEHPDTLTSTTNLATMLHAQGDLPGARALQEKVLEVRRRVSGMKNLETLKAMNNLALTLYDQSDLPGARALLEKVLEVRRRVSGERHSDTIISAWNLAYVLLALREDAALVRLRSNCLDWLLSTAPATLSGDQIRIRNHLGELHVPGRPPRRKAP